MAEKQYYDWLIHQLIYWNNQSYQNNLCMQCSHWALKPGPYAGCYALLTHHICSNTVRLTEASCNYFSDWLRMWPQFKKYNTLVMNQNLLLKGSDLKAKINLKYSHRSLWSAVSFTPLENRTGVRLICARLCCFTQSDLSFYAKGHLPIWER